MSTVALVVGGWIVLSLLLTAAFAFGAMLGRRKGFDEGREYGRVEIEREITLSERRVAGRSR